MTQCAFCDNVAPVDELEGFPKYVIGDFTDHDKVKGDPLVSFEVCRDCFELAYRGSTVENRRWNVTAQCVVLVP